MAYRVLARKYRPQTFDELIGQSHVATTLANALRSQKVAHAYLFSGPRGVGKTTTARVLAKALNCEKGPTATPCNACESCRRIADGHELVDVLEIDAASNRGIEEIRELRENVRYAPAHSRYKVYIIDEAHQITHDAFNAFLKTLEEPPEHAVFILATTEHQKIPFTILSRCQLFRFKRVSIEDLTAQLERILAQEKLQVEKLAVVRLARAAGGSVRDALSLLDQALAYASETLTVQQVEMLLGFLPEEFLGGFAQALLQQEPLGVLQWIKRLAEEGWDFPQFVRDFREYLRETLTNQLAAGAKPESLKLGPRVAPLGQILQMIKVLGQSLDEMRWNDNPRLVLELYALRLTQPFVDAGVLLRRLEELEKGSPHPNPLPSSTGEGTLRKSIPVVLPRPPQVGEGLPASDFPVEAGRPLQAVGRGGGEGTSVVRGDVDPSPVNSPSLSITESSAPADTAAQWKQLIADLWKKPAVASHMERARLKSATAAEWTIAFADKFGLDQAQRAQALIQESLAKILGRPARLRFIQETRPAVEETVPELVVTPSAQARLEERQPALVKDPGVQKVLETFKGRIRTESE